MSTFDPKLVKHIANLANIPLKAGEEINLAQAFDETLEVIEKLKELDTTKTLPTYQVTGLKNVFREDVIEEKRMFSQEEALKNAPSVAEGYFLVPRIIDKD